MAESQVDLIVKFVQVGFVLLILVSFLYKRRRLKLKGLNWFLLIFGLTLVQGIAELVTYYIKIYMLDLDYPSHFKYNELHGIPYGMAVMAIYLMAESMDSDKPDPLRLSFLSGLWASYITLLIHEIMREDSLMFDQPGSTLSYKTVFDIFQFAAMLFVSIIFWKAYRISKNKANRRAALAMFVSTITYVLAALYEIGEDFLGFTPMYGGLTFIFAFIVLAYVFLRYPYFVYSSPSPIYRLMITTEFGVYLYSVQTDDEGSPDELLASALASIALFIKAETRSSSGLHTVSTGDRAIMIAEGEHVKGILLAEKATRALRYALEQLVAEFEREYCDDLERYWAELAKFQDSIPIVLRCFPYIESKEVVKFQYQAD